MSSFIEAANGVIWGAPMLTFFLFIGIYFTFKSRFFQIRGAKKIYNTTIKTIFRKNGTTIFTKVFVFISFDPEISF